MPRAEQLLRSVVASVERLSPVPLEITSVAPFDDSAERGEAIRVLGLPLDPDAPQPREVSVTGRAGAEEFQLFLLDRGAPEEQVAACANALADAVQEALGPLPFPTCPGHGHPAVLEHRAERVYWCCPATRGTPLATVTASAA